MHLPESELALMKLLWRNAPRTAEDLWTETSSTHGWQPNTVKTLLARLVRRGAITATRDGKRHLYAPHWRRGDYVTAAAKSFLGELFDGRLTSLVAHLAEHRALGAAEKKRLKSLLEQIENDG
jgi:predicted transcriptional regulator